MLGRIAFSLALTATTLVIFALGTVCVVSILKLAAGG